MSKQQIQTQTIMTCHRPTRVLVDNHLQTVSCGKCPSCLLSRINHQVGRIKAHAKRFNYCYFVTLTYAPEYLPILRYTVGDRISFTEIKDFNLDTYDKKQYTTQEVKEFLFIPQPRNMKTALRRGRKRTDSVEPMFSHYVPTDSLERLRIAQGADLNTIYYAPTRDLQLFLKRFRHDIKRKYIFEAKKISQNKDRQQLITDNTQISYYAIREFGENKKRPHWHILLFFNSEFIKEHVINAVGKAWLYGITDTQLSRGESASYVSSYLQSTAFRVEVFNRVPELRPKYYASRDFGDDILPKRTNIRDFAEVSDIAVNGRVTNLNGSFVRLFPKWSDFSRLFFRPKGFDALALNDFFALFRSAWYECQYCPSLEHPSPLLDSNVPVNDIAFHILHSRIKELFYEESVNDKKLKSILESQLHCKDNSVFLEYARVKPFIFHLYKEARNYDDWHAVYTLPMFDFAVARLARYLAQFRAFLRSWSVTSYDQMVELCTMLYNFHKKNDYNKLLQEYRKMRDVSDETYTNFIYSQKYSAYGTTTQAEIYEISSSNEKNPLFRDSANQATFELKKIMNHKKVRHLLSNL